MRISLSCGSEIDDRNSQYGQNLSPAVFFEEEPEATKSKALFMENLNASEARKVHWVIWNIPASINLPEGLPRREKAVLDGMIYGTQGNNSFDIIGYQGPKYPPGNEKYRFSAYALDTRLNVNPGSNIEQVRQAFSGHVLDKASAEAGYTN